MKFLIVACLLVNLPLLVKAETTQTYEADIESAGALETATIKLIEAQIVNLEKAVKEKEKALDEQKKSLNKKDGSFSKAIANHQDADKALRDASTELTNQLAGQPIYSRRGRLRSRRTHDHDAIGEAGRKVALATSALNQAQEEYKKAETKYHGAETKVEKAGTALENTTADYAAKVKTKGENEAVKTKKMAAMKLNIEDLKIAIGHAEVSRELASLGMSITDNELKLAVLENTYNQGLIGDFVKVKLEGMMSDPQFCEATKACPPNTDEKSTFKPNLEGLFTSTDRDRKKDLESH